MARTALVSFFMVVATAVLGSCTTRLLESETELALREGELNLPKWQPLNRFPARYPIEAAIKDVMGCATVEYVILPSNEVTNIEVTHASERVFRKSSVRAVMKWHWENLPQGTINQPIKTRTRFNYCMDMEGVDCREVFENPACPGDDALNSIGKKVVRKA